MDTQQMPSQARTAWERITRAECRNSGNPELLSIIDSDAYLVADAKQTLDPASQAVINDIAGERLRLARAELARRESLFAAGDDVSDPHSPTYEAWREMARQVNERADILALLRMAGCDLNPNGKEWAGPCPNCDGEDRFVVWTRASSERPGYACRQCRISGDVIAAYQNFLVPGSTFFDSVRYLGNELGLHLSPDFGMRRPARTSLGEIRPRVGELRRVG